MKALITGALGALLFASPTLAAPEQLDCYFTVYENNTPSDRDVGSLILDRDASTLTFPLTSTTLKIQWLDDRSLEGRDNKFEFKLDLWSGVYVASAGHPELWVTFGSCRPQ